MKKKKLSDKLQKKEWETEKKLCEKLKETQWETEEKNEWETAIFHFWPDLNLCMDIFLLGIQTQYKAPIVTNALQKVQCYIELLIR